MNKYEYALFISVGNGHTEVVPILLGDEVNARRLANEYAAPNDDSDVKTISGLVYSVQRRKVGEWKEYTREEDND